MSSCCGSSACCSSNRMRAIVVVSASCIGRLFHVPRQPESDAKREDQRQAEQSEQLEIDPKVGGKVERDDEVDHADHSKKNDPQPKQLFPDARRDDDLRTQN